MKRKSLEVLESLSDLIADLAETDSELRREILAEYGVDRDRLASRITRRKKILRQQDRIERAKEAKTQILVALSDYLSKKKLEGSKEKLLARLKEVLGPQYDDENALAFFHKYESLDEDDAREMLSELEIVRAFFKEEEGSGKGE
jgi:isopropylmalate/homocitrate/citramalate synthase